MLQLPATSSLEVHIFSKFTSQLLIPDILSSLAISPSQPILLLLYFLSFSVG
jgi:hypothetical protein